MAKYLSADELYRYLHISKRKLKYLLENDYIPCIDTGKKTHRFLIKASDAKEFKRRMDTEAEFLYARELRGISRFFDDEVGRLS